MRFHLPQLEELKAVAAALGQSPDEATLEAIRHHLEPFAEAYDYLEEQADELPPVQYAQRSYRFPDREENALGGWYVKTDLKGKAAGPLHGKSVAIKDNIFVAGVPMMNGASFLEGFVPDFDATVVTRLLDAGAEIAGKAVCEFLCVSGGSTTASTGIVHNPRNPAYSAGGSSSGSAALVAAGEVDMALGCDQAGSIRIPSSFCGVCGMKPSHGLVPYTGILGMEATLDHVGPITATVADNALLLEVLAGYDEFDGRQRRIHLHRYGDAIDQSISGLRIAVVTEGFAHPLSEAAVDECVREAAERFRELGAEVAEVSVPMHRQGVAIWGGVITEGLWQTLRLNGLGYNTDGVYSPALLASMQAWRTKLAQFPINGLMLLLLGKYLERYGNRYYARAKNLVRRLRNAYDRVLGEYDVLLMPTTVQQAPRNPASRAELTTEQIMSDAFNTVLNTCQFDISGHPAISIPCGLRNALPVGMMLAGRQFDEPTLYRAAHAFEQSGDWRQM
ncbi:MAG: amidase [Gammaproteobacteria bacterium]